MNAVLSKLIVFCFISCFFSFATHAQTTYLLSPDNSYTAGGNVIQLKAMLITGNKIVFTVSKKDGTTFTTAGVMTIRAGAIQGCVANNDSYYWNYSAGSTTTSKTFDLDEYTDLGSEKDWYAAIGRPATYCDGTPPTYYSGRLHLTVQTTPPPPPPTVTPTRPARPTVSVASSNSVDINWAVSSDASIYRLLSSSSTSYTSFQSIYCGTNRNYTQTGLSNGTYYYGVQAGSSAASCDSDTGWSAMSNYEAATLQAVSDYTLQINIAGAGTVTGTTGIDCSASCSKVLGGNSSIQLTATPTDSKTRFSGWNGACSGSNTSCLFDMNQASQTITATFTTTDITPPPAALAVTSITPNHLTQNQATEANASSWFDLTIKGSGFQNGAVVFIPGVAHDNVRVNSASEIVVRVKAVYGSSTNPPVPVGDRTVSVKNPDNTRIDKTGVLTVEDLPNQAPVLNSSSALPLQIAPGAAIRFDSFWSDADKDLIVDVTLRYRRLGGGIGPDGDWKTVVLPWLGSTQSPIQFGAALQLNEISGYYEYQFAAADIVEDVPNAPRLHPATDWKAGGHFDILAQPTNNQAPTLKFITAPSWVMPSKPFVVKLQAADPDFNLKEIQIDWTGKGGADGMVTAYIAADGEIVAPTQIYNLPLNTRLSWTSTAYDTSGAKSKMVKGSLYIGRPPQPTVQKKCPPSNPSLSASCTKTSDKSTVGDPINPATGTQSISYTLLSVRGQQTLAFSLAYDSGLLENGLAGKGWNVGGAQARVEELAQGDVKVHWDAAQYNLFVLQEDGSYLSLDSATRYDTLMKNADGSFSLTRQNKAVYHFDSTGNLSEARNAAGQRVTFQRDASGRLERIAEPGSGIFLQYAYNADGLLESVTDSLNRTVRLVYTTGLLTAITDAAGQTTTYTYDAAGRILTAVNAEGTQLFANTYDAQGRVIAQDDGLATTPLLRLAYSEDAAAGTFTTTVTNRDSTTRVYTYDGGYQLLSFQDELGNISRSEYNGSGRPERLLDAKSRATVVAYDERGNPAKVTDSKGNASLLRYDARDNLIEIADAKGNKTLLAYNADNDLISLTNAKNQTTQLAYSAPGVLSSTQSPKGATTRYEYANGLPVKITDAENGVTTLAYDDAGRLESITDAVGKITSLEYDAVNRLVAVTDPLGRTLRFAYNAQDKLVSLTDAKGNVTTREYNANGNLASETNALSQTTRYEYDAEDRLIKVTDAKGHATQIGYDAAGRVISGTDALGHTRKIELDAVGNVQRQLDALNQAVATYEYDELDNLVSLSDALGNTSRLEYDALSNLVAAIDPLARTTRFQHDELQRLAQATDALNGNSQQAFDADGNRQSFQDPNGNTTGFTHDKKGRVTAIEVADGKVRYTFTADDLLKQVTNARNQARDFSYDAAGRLTGWTDADGVVVITYDANDNVLSITDAQGTAAYESDALDRVTKYTDVLGNVMAYSYDEVGKLATLTYPGGKVVKYEYDAAGHLVKVSDWANRATAYSYDANGRLLQTAYANGTKETRTYNLAGQMTQKSVQDAAGKLMVQYDYVFDAAGNITEEKLSPAALEAMTENLLANMSPLNFTYGAANRLATVNGAAVTFDADGNMVNGPLNGETQAFQYDSRNRLTSVGAIAYRYDAQNHRIGVSVSSKETTYAINPVPALSQTLVRTKPDGTQTYYVHGLGLIGEESGGAYQVYHYDLRGTTVALSNAQGAVTEQFAYSPYGGLVSHSPAMVDTPFLYNGRDGVMTDDTGLYYMRARFYNPELRRFVNQDPLLGFVEDGQSLNRYAYVTGEPVSFVDPFGLVEMSLRPTSLFRGLLTFAAADAATPEPTDAGAGYKVAGYAIGLCVLGLAMGVEYVFFSEPYDKSYDDSYDTDYVPPVPPLDPCEEIENMCIAECTDVLPTKDHGFTFWRCVNNCKARHGCL